MKHQWTIRVSDGWIEGTCARCGRTESVLPLPGFGGPIRTIHHDVGTHRSCPDTRNPTAEMTARLREEEVDRPYWLFAIAAALAGVFFILIHQ